MIASQSLENKIGVWNLSMLTLALNAFLHHHRADCDDLVADEISGTTTAVNDYKSVASLEPKKTHQR